MLFGLIHNWPGAKNSEFDIIHRIAGVLGDLGHEAVIIDPAGFELDAESNYVPTDLNQEHLVDVVLNFHYLNPKYLPGLSYVVNWNPVEYLLDDPITRKPVPEVHLRYITDCLRSHDRVLSAGSDKLDGLARVVREGRQPDVLDPMELMLHTTMPAELPGDAGSEAPAIADELKVFYIGNNWERLSASSERKVRHEGLFEILDLTGRFEFYGVREQGGIKLWEGIQSYKSELPFDGGRSIVQASRRCGISLVLSSDQHRASELVSTRIFQACAAETVIISDRNKFIERNFADSVLYFDYGDTAAGTAENIMNQLSWIDANREEAEAMGRRASSIFRERFSLESEIAQICTAAEVDLGKRQEALATSNDTVVIVHALLREYRPDEFTRLLENVAKQSLSSIQLSLYVAPAQEKSVRAMLSAHPGGAPGAIRVLVVEPLSVGESMLHLADRKADYHLWYTPGFNWNRDHVANLVLTARKADLAIAHTPYFGAFKDLAKQQDTARYFLTGLRGGFRKISRENLEGFSLLDIPLGNLLFHSGLLNDLVEAHGAIGLFDLGAVAVAIRHAMDDQDRWPIGISCPVTSTFTGTEEGNYLAHFDEYLLLPGNGLDIKERDQRLGRVLHDCSRPVVRTWETGPAQIDRGAFRFPSVSDVKRHLVKVLTLLSGRRP